ncbi:SUF system NifU family Fe-S cluster assembly protein [bacterium]|nr:SUF system NifU family Fe-S cluster assembly protein [bacterium]
MRHNRDARFFGEIDHATHEARGNNPLCGDEIRLQLQIEQGQIQALAFAGEMSAITRASANMLCELLLRKNIAQAQAITKAAMALLRDADANPQEQLLGEFSAMQILRQFPNRIKTATLPWAALDHALKGDKAEVSTEGD